MYLRSAILGLSLVLLAPSADAQEREWLLDAADEDVYLLFGVPNTNDVGISFWCKIGQNELSVFAPMPASAKAGKLPIAVELTIADKAFKLQPTVRELEDGGSVEAPMLAQQSAILDKLQTAERISIKIANHTATYPLEGADFPAMLRLCANKPSAPEN